MARPTQREDQANASLRRLARLTESAPVGAGPPPGTAPGGPPGAAADGPPGELPRAVTDGPPGTAADGHSNDTSATVANGQLAPSPGVMANGQLNAASVTVADVSLDGAPRTVADRPPGGESRTAVKPIKVGWRVRRWLPPGTTEVRLDPGRRAAAVLAVVLVLGAAIAGLGVWRSRPVTERVPAALPAASDGSQTPTTVELVVSVAGLVARPGLFRLPAGARVADAVAAAGGPAPGTDLTGLNLARRLTDGEHVVVGPSPAAPAAAGQAGQGAPPSGSGARVDLNTATLAELDALPGVGPVTAQRILDWRADHGRFTAVDQLREIEGIGETRFARLRDLVTA